MTDGYDGGSQALLFGHDNGLLTTRQLLLSRDECHAVIVRTMQDFRACTLGHGFQLVLLCQSLSADECQSAAQFTREHAPSTRVLVMFSRVGKCLPDHADVLLDSLAGPKVFIETARRMLDSSTTRAA